MDKKVLKSLLLDKKREVIIGAIISIIINFIATGGLSLLNLSKIKALTDQEKYIRAMEEILSIDVIGYFLLILFIVGFTILLFNNKCHELKEVVKIGYRKKEIFISKYVMVFFITIIGVLPNAFLRFLLIGGIIRCVRYFFIVSLTNLVFFTFFMLFQMLIKSTVISTIIALYIPCTVFFFLMSCELFFSKYFWILTDIINYLVDSTVGNIINYVAGQSIIEKGFTVEYLILIIILTLICCSFVGLSYVAYMRVRDYKKSFYFVFIRRVVYYINAYNITFVIFTCIIEGTLFYLIYVNKSQEFIKFILNLVSIALMPFIYALQEEEHFRKAILRLLSQYKLGGKINANSRKRA